MDEQQRQAFNLAVDLYTDLLFEQKELIFRIIETSYTKGVETTRLQIQAELSEQIQAHVQEQEQEQQQRYAEPVTTRVERVEEKEVPKPIVRSGIVR